MENVWILAGGIALAFVQYLKEMMKDAGVKARFVRGGSTQFLVDLLVELMQVFRCVVHLAQQDADLCLQLLECHDSLSSLS